MNWARQIPNALSLLRLLLSPLLFLAFGSPPLFIALYAACGASDLLDGWLARRRGWTSQLGQQLDSAADLAFFAALACIALFKIGAGLLLPALPLLASVAALRLLSLLVALLKYRAFAPLHTWANKASGLLVYLAFPLSLLLPAAALAEAISIPCLLAAAEELLIQLTSPVLDRDRKSILSAWKRGRGGGRP